MISLRGLYSSEYIVGSYGISNIDMHLGLGWGRLNRESDVIRILLHLFTMARIAIWLWSWWSI